jgi:superfamily II DNA/RNA helicase
MTTNLLKRLESSVEAFRLTLRALSGNISRTLEAIQTFERTGSSASVTDHLGDPSLDADDDDLNGLDEFTVGRKIQISLSDMDLPSWKHDLDGDLVLIHDLIDSMDKVGPGDDAKLQHLKGIISRKIAEPLNPGNRKVLIFTAFADTAKYLYANLSTAFLQSSGLQSALVTGSDAPRSTLKKSYDFQSLLTLFSPRAKEKQLVLPHEKGEIDILIGTDCISEGQNLQDCDYLVNYDIHWNPVRIIQRFGRIDRIGSPNAQIQLVNYWPDISLDEYINLRERVENRMMIADVTATGDDNVLTAKSSDIAYRKEQLKRLQEEVIELQTGIQSDGLTDEQLKAGDGFALTGSTTKRGGSVHSLVKYDLLGKIAENTEITRRTAAEILTGIQASVFGQFKENPEHFIAEGSRIIAEQKATMVIERLAYDGLTERYDVDIFTANQTGQDFSKATTRLRRHIYDYVVTDSEIERKFADDLDTSNEVVVYAKLPRGFLIPTPVGDYNPDWAISFEEGSVKHIYFVAETKGTMSSMKLREIENTKIACARKFFDEIGRRVTEDRVKYDVVTSYEKLMDVVGCKTGPLA